MLQIRDNYCFLIFPLFLLTPVLFSQINDWRLITNGTTIYENGYCDQPYFVVTHDGTWFCTFTTSPAEEGSKTQYIVSCYSRDKGITWSTPIEIESSNAGIEASWAMPLITDYNRIYVFYTFNGDTIRNLPGGNEMRADTHGWYCFRYSDDMGVTWSERFRLPMRKTKVDRNNDFGGDVQMFWGIGKPVKKDQNVWFSFTKLGGYFLEEGEGWLFHSDNIHTEKDVSKINWEVLPDGDHGIRNLDLGSVQEEHNIQPMNQKDGLYCVYRTTLGQPAESYSFDGGHTWTEPQLISYATGLPLRNPRACPRLWKCNNGKYLLWYHNHGGKDFNYRNPAWISGGVEKEGRIFWSQPEILLYGPDKSYETGRFSYPDLIEEEGKYWISTTQKTAATLHAISEGFFEILWSQFENNPICTDGLLQTFKHPPNGILLLSESVRLAKGFAVDFWIEIDKFSDSVIFEGLNKYDINLELRLDHDGDLLFTMNKDTNKVMLRSDPKRLREGIKHHVAILIDPGPNICYMIIDGSICDGGGVRTFGFEWLSDIVIDSQINRLVLHEYGGTLHKLRVYNKPILASQMVNNYTAEKINAK